MRSWLLLLAVVAGGCGYLSNERYTLLGCSPELGVCKAFDTYSGNIVIRPLPTLPAERGEREVKK